MAFASAAATSVAAVPAAASFTALEPVSHGRLAADGITGCGESFTADGDLFTGFDGAIITRGFLIFDLSGVSGDLVGATLAVQDFLVATPDGSEDAAAFALSSTSVSTLRDGTVDATVYSDLGTGLISATHRDDRGERGHDDRDARSALADGDQGAFGDGFALISCSGGSDPEGVFSASRFDAVRLTLELAEPDAAVPLPALALGLGALAALRGARRRG